MTEEQLDADVKRMAKKRVKTLSLIEEFYEWHGTKSDGDRLVYINLCRDALRGDEVQVDELTVRLEEKCGAALLKKMGQ